MNVCKKKDLTFGVQCYLPFQSIYMTAMDREMDNSNATQATSAVLLGHKFLEPLASRRAEHERRRALRFGFFFEIFFLKFFFQTFH